MDVAAAIHVLDIDAELGASLPDDAREQARATLVARAYEAAPGPWQLRQPPADRSVLGLLVAEGILGLRTEFAGRATLELVGRGDLLRPWVQLGAEMTAPPVAEWEVITPSRLLLLDCRFAQAAGRWPEIVEALMDRSVIRARRLCYQLAVNASPRAEDRVWFALWAIADRWGRVTDGGTVVPIRLTHQQLSELVGTQRPSVSAALSRLREDGRIGYSRDGFVLHGTAPDEVLALRAPVSAP